MTAAALFVSHGAPDLAIAAHPAGRFLDDFALELKTTRAVLVVSAHHQCQRPTLVDTHGGRIVHDYRGFDPALREIRHPAPEAPDLVHRVATLLTAAGLPFDRSPARPLDHGAWVPLHRLDPEARIPVAHLSLGSGDASAHLALGRALEPLLSEGVLLLTSGALTHGLPDIVDWNESDTPAPHWVQDFASWSQVQLEAGAESELLAWETLAPAARRNHPTPEHLLPLFVAMGAAGSSWIAERLHTSVSRSVLAMEMWRFAPR